jgi:hypothetical protein
VEEALGVVPHLLLPQQVEVVAAIMELLVEVAVRAAAAADFLLVVLEVQVKEAMAVEQVTDLAGAEAVRVALVVVRQLRLIAVTAVRHQPIHTREVVFHILVVVLEARILVLLELLAQMLVLALLVCRVPRLMV